MNAKNTLLTPQILVLDFGSQYTQLIARRLRESGIYTEIVPYFENIESIKAKRPKGIILSGGPASIYEEGAYKPDGAIFELGIPVLGICYGMQYIAHFFGGVVAKASSQEFGKATLEILNRDFELSKDAEGIFAQWKASFFGAHGFMSKGLLEEIADFVKNSMQEAQEIWLDRRGGIARSFGIFKQQNFACYDIERKEPYEDVLRRFLTQMIQTKNLQDSIHTNWDKHDRENLKKFIELGFEPSFMNGDIVHLSAEISTLRQTLGLENRQDIFAGVSGKSIVWMSHADKVVEIPQGFIELAKSGNTHYCAIANPKRQIYAIQFHPEVVHSEFGSKILENFALQICGANNDWSMKNFIEIEIERIQNLTRANEGKVLCAVSGGVDSSVVASLLYQAIGERLIPIFVDTGLLRLGEREAVEGMFRENLKVPLISIDARAEFLGLLKGVRDPEQKRKIIGETFIKVFEREAKKYNDEIKFLAQGTLYPDVIESVSIKGPSKTIKSHHNVGGLPEWMRFELIEPLRELFKDEVRALGRELGMPEMMLMRHPFPGPGLAIRIMGEVNEKSLDLLRKADAIFIEELHRCGLYDKVWQAFCVLLNVQSVGVMGDNRTYDNTICLRAVEALDGMSASFAHLSHDFLESVSNRIINEVKGINRVVYDITSKPPGTIEWE